MEEQAERARAQEAARLEEARRQGEELARLEEEEEKARLTAEAEAEGKRPPLDEEALYAMIHTLSQQVHSFPILPTVVAWNRRSTR